MKNKCQHLAITALSFILMAASCEQGATTPPQPDCQEIEQLTRYQRAELDSILGYALKLPASPYRDSILMVLDSTVEIPPPPPVVRDTFLLVDGDTIDIYFNDQGFVGDTDYTLEQWDSIVRAPISFVVSSSLVLFLDNETLLTDGNAFGAWKSHFNEITASPFQGGVPILDINDQGEPEWKFSGSEALVINTDSLDFDADQQYTVFVRLGSDTGTTGTILGKTDNGDKNVQFQLGRNQEGLATNLGRYDYRNSSLNDWPTDLDPYDVLAVRVMRDSLEVYRNGEFVFSKGERPTRLDATNDFKWTIGARFDPGPKGIGYGFDGSITKVLIDTSAMDQKVIKAITEIIK